MKVCFDIDLINTMCINLNIYLQLVQHAVMAMENVLMENASVILVFVMEQWTVVSIII